MTKEQVARRIEQLDARVSISSAGRFAAVRLTSPRDTFDDALRLIVDILRNPALSEEEFERTRARSIAALESEERSPGMVADEAMNKFFDRYPKGHADAFRTSEEKMIALKTTTIEQVRAFHRDYFGTADGEAAVIGDFDPAHMKALLTAELTGWHSRHPHSHKPEPYSQPATVVRQSIETPDKANAVIVSRSNIDMNVTNPDYPALVIAAQIFGSGVMSSRLGTRVRGREGLSYYVGGNVIIDPIDTNSIFYMQATSAPENMPKVEAGMREELARFVRDGVTERELADAKEGMLATYADRRSSDIGLAGALRGEMFHGRTLEWTADMEDRMRALTVEQVNAAIRRHIKPEMVSTFVAGDFDRVSKQVVASTK